MPKTEWPTMYRVTPHGPWPPGVQVHRVTYRDRTFAPDGPWEALHVTLHVDGQQLWCLPFLENCRNVKATWINLRTGEHTFQQWSPGEWEDFSRKT